MNARAQIGMWLFVAFIIAAIGLVISHFIPDALFDLGSNQRSTTINNVPVTYEAAWGHSGYPCVMSSTDTTDVTTNDNSVSGQTLSIDGNAPNTGSKSCSTYSIGATYHVTFDPSQYSRMIIHGSRSTTCNANNPYASTSINDLVNSQTLSTDGTVSAAAGDIVITNNAGIITIDSNEGHGVITDTTKPAVINVSTNGGNKMPNRMYGCDLHLGITSIETTTISGTTTTNATNTTSTGSNNPAGSHSLLDTITAWLKSAWTWLSKLFT